MNLDNQHKKQRRIAEDKLEIAMTCIDRCITDKIVLEELNKKLKAIN